MRYAMQESLIASNPANDLTGAIAPPPKNHYPALPLEKMPELLERLESYSGRLLTRLAVQLNLLIFIRSSELRFARWTEIDLDGALWTIPAQREPIPGVRYSERGAKMKMPSTQAVTVLKQLKLLSGSSELLFPCDHDPRKPMSENTINKALRVMESLFRTLKYVPRWPSSGFRTLEDARNWVDKFTRWYNEEHRHSGIRYVTPAERHRGDDISLLKGRDELYREAQKAHPERGSGRTKNWQPQGSVTLNPERENQAA